MTESKHTDGWTLQQFMGATQVEVANGMTKATLDAAAKQESQALGDWMTKVGGEGIRAELAGHVVGFLQGDIGEVFAGVWSRCTALRTSAEETKGKPGMTQLVALTDHDFTYSMAPEVEVVVAGVPLGSFKFSVELTCTVKALELQVRDGGIAAVRSGECEGHAAILLLGTPLWQRELGHTTLPGVVQWEHPLALLQAAT